MAKELKCGDLMPGCDFKAEAEDMADLMEKVVDHAKEVHGIEVITPELAQKVQAAIKDA